MDELQAANAIVNRLRACLEEEIEHSRERCQLIRTVDSKALLESARHREEFNRRLALLDDDLRVSLHAASRKLGLADGRSVSDLGQDTEPGRRLAESLVELRTLVAVLREIDERNRALTIRALKWVRGCISVLAPTSVGYDRTGSRPAHGPVSTSVRVA